MDKYFKDPDSTISISVNWGSRLATNDTIATSTWTSTSGLTIVSNSFTNSVSTVWLSSGTALDSYILTNRITTVDGAIEEESFLVYVNETDAPNVEEADVDIYMTVAEANIYMARNKLDKSIWDQSSPSEKVVALNIATKRIDRLAFKGEKSVATQTLQFPRSGDTSAPQAIKDACAEIAFNLIDGRNPEYEYDDLRVSSQTIGGVKITSETSMVQPYKVAGIPSPEAWSMLLPYIRDFTSMPVERV